MPRQRHRLLIAAAIFCLALTGLFATLDSPGVTLDEPYVNRPAAISFVTWMELAWQDVLRGDWAHLVSKPFIKEYFKSEYTFHPPFARLLAGISWKIFHPWLDEMRALRLAPAFLFSLSAAALFLLVSRYYGLAPGIAAAMGLYLCPAPFGHAHLIALDSPIASMWVITVYCFVKGLESRGWAVGFAIAAGLSMNTKIHGFAIPAPLFLWSLLYQRDRMRPNLLAFLALSPLTVILTFPKLWYSPVSIIYFLEAMSSKQNYEQVSTVFMGKTYGFSPPKYYAFLLTPLALPPLTFLLSLAGLVCGAARDIKALLDRGKTPGISVLFLFNALTALGLTLFTNIPLYDGVRLFLPAFPFFAALAGVGVFHLAARCPAEKFRSAAAPALAAALAVSAGAGLVRIHPFYLSYFNSFIGGLQGANKLGFESTYWNDAFTLDTARMMNEKYKNKVFSEVTGLKYTLRYYKERGILDPSITQHPLDYDYYLLLYRQGWFNSVARFYATFMIPEYSVRAEGVPLLEIFPSPRLESAARLDLRREGAGQKITAKGFEWLRYLLVPQDGLYLFGIFSPYTHDFRIGHKPVPYAENPRATDLRLYRLHLRQGIHPLALTFPGAAKPLEFHLAWVTPRGKKGLIPAGNLLWPEADSSGGDAGKAQD